MQYQEFVRLLARELKITKAQTIIFLNAFKIAVAKGLISQGVIKVRLFGTFSVRDFKARRIYDYQTKTTAAIAAHKWVHFKPSKTLRALVNKK